MCDSIANGGYIPPAAQCCPPANVIVASNVLSTNGNVIAGNIISQDGTFTGNLYVAGQIVGNIIYSSINISGTANITTLQAGTVQAGLYIGNGSGLSNLNASNLAFGIVDAARIYGNTLSNLQFSNLTGVLPNTFGNLNASNLASGIVDAARIYGNTLSNLQFANVTGVLPNTFGNLNASNLAFGIVDAARIYGNTLSNLNGSNVTGNVAQATTALVVTQAAQPNITSVGTLSSLTVTGTASAGTFSGSGSGLTNIPGSSITGSVQSAVVAQVVSQASQPNITSVGTLISLSVTGTVFAGTFSGSGASLTNIPASSVEGTVGTAASVTNAAQPNITSVGTLTGLNVQGLLTASNGSGISNLNASNVSSGTLPTTVFPLSGVTAGPYGSSSNVAAVTIDQYGRVTTASNITITSSQWTGTPPGPIYYQNYVGIGSSATPSANLQVTGNVHASNSVTTPNIYFTNQIQATNLPTSGVSAGTYGSSANVSQVTVDQYGRVTSASNVSFTATSQWTTVSGNVAYQNGVSIGTLSNPPDGSNLYVLGTATFTNISGNGASISSLNSSNLVGNVANANVALVVSQAAQPNITSVGTLTGLTVNGLLTASNGSGIANITGANVTGNVAQATLALVVSQAAQPNITSVGTLTGLTVNGLLTASNGSGIANITGANVTGNVARANLALVVSQAAQPNITSVGTLTGLTVNGLLIASNGSGIANIAGANVTGNVAQATLALVVSQASQPNITSVGTLTSLNVSGTSNITNLIVPGSFTANSTNTTFFYDTITIPYINVTTLANIASLVTPTANVGALNVISISNLNSLSLSTANVGTLNVISISNLNSLALSTANVGTLNVISISNLNSLTTNLIASQANVGTLNVVSISNLNSLSVTNLNVASSTTTGNLSVVGNVIPVTSGNTYVLGNLVVAGNVFSSLGTPLGFGGSLYFNLGSQTTPSVYTGALYGQTLALSLTPFTVQGSSTALSRSANGMVQFTQTGVYNFRAVFCTTGDNITGVAIGSNVIDYGTRTDQTYVYRYTTFVSQNPTATVDFDFYVGSTTNYYYIDLFAVDAPTLQPTATTSGGTWVTIGPSASGGGVGGSVTISTLGAVVTGQSTSYGAAVGDYYIGMTNGGTVTLPLGATLTAGKQYVIKDESGLAGTQVGKRVTIASTSPNLIDGQTTATIAINYGSINVLWTGTGWSIF